MCCYGEGVHLFVNKALVTRYEFVSSFPKPCKWREQEVVFCNAELLIQGNADGCESNCLAILPNCNRVKPSFTLERRHIP